MPETDDLLPSRATFIRERGEREAQHGIEWTDGFDLAVRKRLYACFSKSYMSGHYRTSEIMNSMLAAFVDEHSDLQLFNMWSPSAEDVLVTATASKSDAEVLDWIAAIPIVLEQFASEFNGMQSDDDYGFTYNLNPQRFAELANDVLLEGRVSWVFINNRLKPRSEEALFVSVIKPVETLLTADPRFEQAETAYLQAQGSIASGHYGAAITSAGSALQATLEALGASGSNLGAIFSDAKRKGFLLGHDEKLLNSYKNILDWATADRSARGTAHGAATAERADAVLAIHVIAAVIVRLIELAPADDADAEEQASPETRFEGF